MSRLALTVQQEIDDFQGWVDSIVPFGARVSAVDAGYQIGSLPGSIEFLAHHGRVLDVFLGAEGPYYSIFFGQLFASGPASQDDYEPRNMGWTILTTDPWVDLGGGLWAAPVLAQDGREQAPPVYVLLNVALGPNDLAKLTRGGIY